jgi:hypothetical protein
MKDRQHNGQKKKEQTTIYKTLHRNLKERASRTPLKTGVNSGVPENGKQFLLH